TADGLPDNRVKRMLVDSRGLLWICTGSGISRFDGSVFENFGLAEGLPFPSINDLIETADGDFWLASNGGGLIRVRLGSSERRYEATPISAEPTSNRVNRLFRGSDGTIWAGTDGGLFRMTTDGGQVAFARVVLKFRGHPDEAAQVWSMAEDHEGALWAGTRFGLVRLAPNGRIVSYPLRRDLENDDVFSLAYAPDDDVLWIGHRTGLLAFRVPALDAAAVAPAAQPVEDDSLTRIVLSPPQALDVPTELPRTPGGGVYFDTARPNAPPAVVDLERSASGTIRFLTPGSVWEWTRDRFAAIHDPRLPPALVSAADDREGNLWLATRAGGLIRIARDGFLTFRESDGLGPEVASVFENQNGDLIVVSRIGASADSMEKPSTASASTSRRPSNTPAGAATSR
ncbi:MAG TPA: two-component regulator propeller domain-containing protein, partial [Vicinamibacterales bacterium]|nr:two-component regulator propeller domain-containing protein [Vicinamibacterales bacterium]